MGLLVFLFLNLATIPPLHAGGPSADDLAIYRHALGDVARSDRDVAEETVSERCRISGMSSSQVARDTLASYVERNRARPKLSSQLRSQLFLNAMNREPEQVRFSAVGWSRDHNQAWLELDTVDFGTATDHCLLYRRVGANFRLQSEIRLPR